MGLGSAVGVSALVVAGMAIYFATDPIRFTREMTTHTVGVVMISGASSGIGLDLGKACWCRRRAPALSRQWLQIRVWFQHS